MQQQNIVNAEIVNGTTKDGRPYKAVDFSITTPSGVYTSRAFPTSLEIGIIEKTLNKMNSIYTDDNENIF